MPVNGGFDQLNADNQIHCPVSAYCEKADILGEIQEPDLISITDDTTPGTGIVDETILAQVIANSSGVIDRLVGNVYEVPFSPTPPSVRSLCLAIVCYRLYRRRLVPDEKNNFTPDYREAMKQLTSINKGESFLDLTVERAASMVAPVVTATPWGYANIPTSSR